MVATTEAKKRRINLSIEESVLERGEVLAKAENRSLNNFIETLLMRADAAAVPGSAVAAPPAAAGHARLSTDARLSVKRGHKKAIAE